MIKDGWFIGLTGFGGVALAQKRIFKLKEGRIIDGVAGGLAEYVGVEALWVRIAWAVLALAGGIGVIAYILAMYLFPRVEAGETVVRERAARPAGTLVVGLILLAVGAMIVLRALGVLNYGFWGAWHVAWIVLWPLSLIGGGLFLLYIYWRQGAEGTRVFRRLGWDKMVMGVCSGLGEFLKIDTGLVRLVFALLIILSRGVALIVYIALGLMTPEAKEGIEEPPPQA
jgi:phage shock protein PspC (stress-responsive transcriptional regulator)